MGVREAGHGVDFEQEALGAQSPGPLRIEHLDRHGAIVLEILGQVDSSHAPAADLSLDPVAFG